MSTSPKTAPPHPPLGSEGPGTHAVAFWLSRVQRLPSGPTAALNLLGHARQALLLAAAQPVAADLLAQLALALHVPLMAQGLVRTWADELQALLHRRPDLLTLEPTLGDCLLSAWTAAGDWGRAQEVLRLWRHRSPEQPLLTARILYRQGSLLWMQGRWLPAQRLANQAWRLAKDAPPLLRVGIAALMALSAWRLGRRKQARRWVHRALEICPPQEHLWRGRLHHYLLLILRPVAPPIAQRHLALALHHLQSAQAPLPLAHLWADSTDLYLTLGDLPRAEEALAQAYRLWRETEDPAGLADFYRHAAIVAYATDHPRLARDYAAHALALWQDLGVRPEIRRCQALLRRGG